MTYGLFQDAANTISWDHTDQVRAHRKPLATRPIDGREFIQRLKGLGVRVAVDDFGAGFSADAAHLCAADIVKIDRLVLWNARRGSLGLGELNRLTSIAQNMVTVVVLEGVETPDDIRIVRSAGVR